MAPRGRKFKRNSKKVGLLQSRLLMFLAGAAGWEEQGGDDRSPDDQSEHTRGGTD